MVDRYLFDGKQPTIFLIHSKVNFAILATTQKLPLFIVFTNYYFFLVSVNLLYISRDLVIIIASKHNQLMLPGSYLQLKFIWTELLIEC